MHKHSSVLQAIAQGKIVFYSVFGKYSWTEMDENSVINPITNPELDWKVKEEFSIYYSFVNFLKSKNVDPVPSETSNTFLFYKTGFMDGVYAYKNGDYS